MHNPQVPETLEGWSILHHMFHVQWDEVRRLTPDSRKNLAQEVIDRFFSERDDSSHTALVHLLGHKADLMIIYFRKDFEELSRTQLAFQQTELHKFLRMSTSYVSIVELGLYEMTAKIHHQLAARSLKPESEEFERAFEEELEDQRKRLAGRLFLQIPKRRYVCFYPMNKRRGEAKNWYMESYSNRSEMMLEHGIVGRGYAGRVTQVISGSIGFDDWEWGVDLFADDPLIFKKLIYEMRFDQASALYAEFGPFYVGLQFSANRLADFLSGNTPPL
jgi:hydrogen peroxide-dependent heme synthase